MVSEHYTHPDPAVRELIARHVAAALSKAADAVDAELAAEEARLAPMGGYGVGMLANWLGGIKVGARIVRNSEP